MPTKVGTHQGRRRDADQGRHLPGAQTKKPLQGSGFSHQAAP